jgi:hypothetical protein
MHAVRSSISLWLLIAGLLSRASVTGNAVEMDDSSSVLSFGCAEIQLQESNGWLDSGTQQDHFSVKVAVPHWQSMGKVSLSWPVYVTIDNYYGVTLADSTGWQNSLLPHIPHMVHLDIALTLLCLWCLQTGVEVKCHLFWVPRTLPTRPLS